MSALLVTVPTSDPYTWRSNVESLSPAKSPCPGLYGEQWQKTQAAMLDFLERFGARAVELGWTYLDLYGIHPQIGTARSDYYGALTLERSPPKWMPVRRKRARQDKRLEPFPIATRSGTALAMLPAE